jgi:SNF2 family DNA or RNA helicase
MATGKTASSLLALSGCQRILVVCPIAVASSWRKQVGIWDESRKAILAVSGSGKQRAAAIAVAGDEERCVVVVNYDSVWRSTVSTAVSSVQWDAIVLDESHRIKGPNSKSAKSLRKLAASQPAAKRLCLTGTPTPQNPLDWWSQFAFLDEGILGSSFRSFRARIATVHPRYPGWVTGFKQDAIADLTRRIDPHVHRVTAEQVLSLPEAIHTQIDVELSPKARRFYEELEEEMVSFLDDGRAVTAANRLSVIGRLQCATSGFARPGDDAAFTLIDGSPAKRLALADWLQDFPRAEPLVIFVRYHIDIDEITSLCREFGRSVSELSGRCNQLQQWQDGETEVLVVQQQSGGCGIDLTRASHVVYYSLSHSLGDYEQSLARVRRPGQAAKTCKYFHLVATGTVDEDIYSALRGKKDVVESVLTRLTRRVPA